jgi:hypothetical protein
MDKGSVMARESTPAELQALKNFWANESLANKWREQSPLLGAYTPRKRTRREKVGLRIRGARTRLATKIAPWLDDYGY